MSTFVLTLLHTAIQYCTTVYGFLPTHTLVAWTKLDIAHGNSECCSTKPDSAQLDIKTEPDLIGVGIVKNVDF